MPPYQARAAGSRGQGPQSPQSGRARNWYQGKHEPLVTKELFEKVQEQLKRESTARHHHEFTFTKLMACGKCESGITAFEKYKKLKDGSTAKYIYYGCSRSKDHNCQGNTFVREDELVRQLLGILDRIDFNELGVEVKFKEELRRHDRFQRTVLGFSDPAATHEDIDLKTYAKYILKEGTNEEKRELMGYFKSRITIENGTLSIAE